MTPEHWQRIKALLESALERKPGERSAFLDEACVDDPSLRTEVESLIVSYEEAGGFIETPAFEAMAESLANSPAESVVGNTLGHYRIIKQLGAGGMGEVYLAEDTRLGRKVALKLLSQHLTQDDEREGRFRQEAFATSALNHPNIVTVYEIGEWQGRDFIATELIEGVTLRGRMRNRRLPLTEALEIALQIAGALAAAHRAGIVHRDIKPENVMLRPDGLVKVLDFGIAKYAEPTRLQVRREAFVKTTPGAVIGTAAYMSPEQTRGLEVDSRTDIWSLGVILYEMVARRLPFSGATPSDRIAAILEREPVPLPQRPRGLPPELERIVSRALAKNKEERYGDAADLAADLRKLRGTLGDERPARFSLPAVVRSAFSTQLISKIKRHKRRAALALSALVVVLAVAAYFVATRSLSNKTVSTTSYTAVAVLPFVNAGADPNAEYISDGITESINNSLSQLAQLRVLARTTMFRYKGKDIDPQKVGRELGVDAVLAGRVTQLGDNLIIQADLIDVADGSQIWGERYNRKVSDILVVQGEIAKTISQKLRLKLTGEEEKQLNRRYTENPEAYQLYLKGRYHWKKLSEDGLQKSIEYFNQAIEKDPHYSLAYSGLADAYVVLGIAFLPPREVFPSANRAAAKALELDETLAAAHISMGAYKLFYEWDWPGAESEAKRAKQLSVSYAKAIELNTNYGDSNHFYCQYLDVIGRPYESIEEIKRALELDPLSINMNMELGWSLYIAREYDQSIEQCQKTLEMDSSFVYGYFCIAQAAVQKEKYEEAISAMNRARTIMGDMPDLEAELGYAYAASRQRAKAQKIVNKLKGQAAREYVNPYLIALVYAGLGEKDQAFDWLQKAYDARSSGLTWLRVEPKFDSLRSDPRFADLLQRIGFPLP